MTTHKTRMPGEWEPHSATWLAWPYGDESFGERVPSVEKVYLQIIHALSKNERLKLIVRPEQKAEIAVKLSGAGIRLAQIDFFEADYADIWTRDWGPTFVAKNGKTAFVKWTYNAYGNKFPTLLKDDSVFDQIEPLHGAEKISGTIVMEGGAIESNGAGIILTTEETLLHKNRNPEMSKVETGEKLQSLLGAEKIIWLKRGLLNDHTDGHIDEIARFISRDTILYAWAEKGPNHERMVENLEILTSATDAEENPFTLIPLPLPSMKYADDEIAPVSYCNFYVANNVVLVPQFNHANDSVALEILGKAFPGRDIIGIDSTDLIYGGGGIHCITQQEPTF